MRALRFDGTLRLDREAPLPAYSGECLVRVRMAGICSTDLEIVRGYKGFTGILGHEFVGETADGARVCGEINVGCRRCDRCRAGLPGHCAARTVLGILDRDGAFADFLGLPEDNLHPLPSSVPDETTVFVEPLAAAFQILEQVEIRPRDRVVVLGDGKLGLLCAQVLALTGATPTVVGKHERNLAIAAEWGLETSSVEAGQTLEADIVVEATGSVRGLGRALEMVRPLGTLVLKTTVAEPAPQDLAPIVVKEITVVGSRCGPFPRAIRALAEREVDVTALIERTYSFDRAIEAFADAAQPGVLKTLLDMR